MKGEQDRRARWSRPRLRLRHRVLIDAAKPRQAEARQRSLLLLVVGLATGGILATVALGLYATREIGHSVMSIKTAIKEDFEETVKGSVGDIIDEFNRRSTNNIKEAVYPNRFQVGIDVSGRHAAEEPGESSDEYHLPSRVDVRRIVTGKKDLQLRVKIKNDSEYPANFVGVSFYIDEESFMESTVDIWDKLRRLALVSTYMEAPPLLVSDGRGKRSRLKGCKFTYDQFESKVPESFCCFDLMLKKAKGFFGVKVRDNVFIFAITVKTSEPKGRGARKAAPEER
jgi:hypothetical protein